MIRILTIKKRLMKTKLLTLLTIISSFTFISCSKDDAGENEKIAFQISEISANIEGQEDNALKNMLIVDSLNPNLYHNFWKEPYSEEKIKIIALEAGQKMVGNETFQLTEVYSKDKEAKFSGKFSGTINMNRTLDLIGIYPQDIFREQVFMQYMKVSFPSNQKCFQNDGRLENTPMIAMCSPNIIPDDRGPTEISPVLKFKNLGGFLRFEVTGSKAADLGYIEVEVKGWSGNVIVLYNGGSPQSVFETGEKHTIRLECDHSMSITPDETNSYLMSVPHNGGYPYNCIFRFYDTQNNILKETIKEYPVPVVRSQITVVPITLN